MRMMIILALAVMAGAVAQFLLEGLPAYDAARQQHLGLKLRVAKLSTLMATSTPVPHAEIDGFDQQLRSLAAQLDERLLLLLESLNREPPPTLATVLTGRGPSWLSLQSPIGRRLVELAAGRPRVDAALARALLAIAAAPAYQLESVEAHHEGQLVPVRGVPELTSYEAEFVVLCEPDQALLILEALGAEPGEPLLTVARASLRRVEPGLWPTEPVGLSSPPVRLWVTVTALFRTSPDRGAR